jgi:hypothetical protein
MHLLSDASATTSNVQNHFGNLIFMGVFFIALFCVGIWWLKRNS